MRIGNDGAPIFLVQSRRRHPRRHLDRPADRRALRRQADLVDPRAPPDRHARRRGDRHRHQGPPRPLRRHPRGAGRRGDGRLRAGRRFPAPPRPGRLSRRRARGAHFAAGATTPIIGPIGDSASSRDQVRRIQARHRAVEEQRIGAVEPVAEQPREGIERHRLLGDGEDRPMAPSRTPTPLRILSRCPGRLDLRMDAPVDDQHRPGLGGVARGRRALRIARRLHDARAAVADIEHAVRLQMEIGRAFAQYPPCAPACRPRSRGRRAKIDLEHAAVHRKAKLAAVRFRALRRGARSRHRPCRPGPSKRRRCRRGARRTNRSI